MLSCYFNRIILLHMDFRILWRSRKGNYVHKAYEYMEQSFLRSYAVELWIYEFYYV